MSIEADVLRGIIGAAVSVIGTTLPIKAPLRKFNPPNDKKYFEVFAIQSNNDNPTWGNEKHFKGQLRIVLHWPIDDAGQYTPIDLLAGVAQGFYKGQTISQGVARLLISGNPSVKDIIDDQTEFLFPLFVPYEFFHVPG